MAKRRQYADEFKKDAVRLLLARGAGSCSEVARGIGVSVSMLHRWHRQFAVELTGKAVQSQDERETVESMRRRLRELEQENALLKKASALFAREMK